MDNPNHLSRDVQTEAQEVRQDDLLDYFRDEMYPVVECVEQIEDKCDDDCPDCGGKSDGMISVAFTRDIIQN